MSDLTPSAAYDLLTATIAPRPIAYISSLDAAGRANVAPFSFFLVGGANPGSLVFSAILNVDGTPKETLKNVEATGEFVANTVHREMLEGLRSAAVSARECTDKWQRCGLTPIDSVSVATPRVAESLAQFECRVFQIVPHGDGPGAARYVIGEVLVAHIASELLVEGKVSGDRVHSVARMGGRSYVDTATLELFDVD